MMKSKNKLHYSVYCAFLLFVCIACSRNYSQRVYRITFNTGDKLTVTHIGETVYLSNDYIYGEMYNGCFHYIPSYNEREIQLCGVRSVELVGYKEDFH